MYLYTICKTTGSITVCHFVVLVAENLAYCPPGFVTTVEPGWTATWAYQAQTRDKWSFTCLC